MFLRLTLSGWAVFFSASENDAAACTCPLPAITVTPRPGQIAPRNTHVWVEVPPELADAAVTLRGGGPVELRRYGSGAERIIEVVPKAPLAEHAKVDVLLGNEVVGQIVVGDAADETPPRWDGLVTGDVSQGLTAGCGAGEPFVTFGLGKRSDDATPTAGLRYAVWVVEAGKPVDYDKPPTTVVGASGDRLVLGHESRCLPANLDLPSTLAVGVRVLDFAGNAGEPSEADVTVKRNQGLAK